MDKTLIKSLEHNGTVIAVSVVHDFEFQTTQYEVTKTLTGTVPKILSRCLWDDRNDANVHFEELIIDIGATDYNDFIC